MLLKIPGWPNAEGVLIHPTHPVCVMRERVRPYIDVHVCGMHIYIFIYVYCIAWRVHTYLGVGACLDAR